MAETKSKEQEDCEQRRETADLVQALRIKVRCQRREIVCLKEEVALLEQFVNSASAFCSNTYSDTGFRDWLRKRGWDKYFACYPDGFAVKTEAWYWAKRRLKTEQAALKTIREA
jgi:hypothetical protein